MLQLILCVVVALTGPATVEDRGQTSREHWERAHDAVVRDSSMDVMAMRLVGTVISTNLDGTRSIPRRVEVRLALPASYVRFDTRPRVISRSGFVQNDLLNAVRTLSPTQPVAGGTYPENQIDTERIRFVRLLLGIGAFELSGLVDDVERIPSPVDSPRAELQFLELRAIAPARRFEIGLDSVSGMPAVVGLEQDIRLPRSEPGPPVTRLPERQRETVWMWCEDRRDIGGVLVPFRFRLTAAGILLEEVVLETVEVNPSFEPDSFRGWGGR